MTRTHSRRAVATMLAPLLSGCVLPVGTSAQPISVGAFGWVVLLFAALCLWQMLAGLAKMRRARANPAPPNAPLLARFGRIQAVAGAVMLVLNLLLNLPLLTALVGR